MLAVVVENTTLDLFPGTSASFTLVNPIFDRDQSPRLYSYPFRVPASPRNVIALGYSNRLDVRARSKQYAGEIHIEGVLFEAGIVKVTGGTEETIEIVFQNTEMGALEDLDAVNIHEILETIPVPFTGTSQWFLDVATDGPWLLQIDDNVYSDSRFIVEDIQEVIDEFVGWINADYPGFSFDTGTGGIGLNINLYPAAVVQLDTMFGFTLQSGQSIEQDRHDSFLAFADDVVQNGDTRIVFPVMQALNLYADQNSQYEGYVNYWKAGAQIDNTPQVDKTWEHTFIPFLRVTYLLAKLVDQLGLAGIAGDLYEIIQAEALCIWNNVTLDDPVEGNFTPPAVYLNQYKQSVDLNQHVPELSGRDLLDRLSFLNFYLEIKNSVLYLKKKVTPLRRPIIDWTEKAEPPYETEIPDLAGWRMEYDTAEKDDTSTILLQADPLGGGENVLTFPTYPVYYIMQQDTHGGSGIWNILLYTAQGTSEALALENDFGVRFFFYRGLQANSEGDDYPMGTNTDEDTAGAAIGDLRLSFSGESGLYEQLWKGYIELTDALIVTKLLRLGIEDLLEVRKWENARRKIYHKQGEMIGVIRSVQFQVSSTGLSPSQVDFVIQP